MSTVVEWDSDLGKRVSAARHIAQVNWQKDSPHLVTVVWSYGRTEAAQFVDEKQAVEFRDALIQAMKEIDSQ